MNVSPASARVTVPPSAPARDSAAPSDAPVRGKSAETPPGLARRGLDLPPGIAAKVEKGGSLPAGIARRFPQPEPEETPNGAVTESAEPTGTGDNAVDILA